MPSKPRPPRPTLTYETMEAAVERLSGRSVIDPSTGCWVATTGLTGGYSQVSIGGWPFLGHRVAYLLLRCEIPQKLTDLDHFHCQNKACWNPWHVEPVTHAENMARHHEKKYGARKLPPIWVRRPGYSTPYVQRHRKSLKENR